MKGLVSLRKPAFRRIMESNAIGPDTRMAASLAAIAVDDIQPSEYPRYGWPDRAHNSAVRRGIVFG